MSATGAPSASPNSGSALPNSSGDETNSSGNATNSDSDLTQSHDEATKLQMGLTALRAMETLAVDTISDRAAKAFQDGNLQLWRSRLPRLGLKDQGAPPPGDDDVKLTARVDSPDVHHHYHPDAALGPLAAALLGGAITAGLAAGAYWLTKPQETPAGQPPAAQDSDTRSTLRPYLGPDPVQP